MLKFRFFLTAAFVFIAAIIVTGFIGYSKISDKALAGAGYNAKILCSSVFLSGRNPAGIDRHKLQTAMQFAFIDPDPAHPIGTRAVVAV